MPRGERSPPGRAAGEGSAPARPRGGPGTREVRSPRRSRKSAVLRELPWGPEGVGGDPGLRAAGTETGHRAPRSRTWEDVSSRSGPAGTVGDLVCVRGTQRVRPSHAVTGPRRALVGGTAAPACPGAPPRGSKGKNLNT